MSELKDKGVKAERLAAQLRENLRKRKEQARALTSKDPPISVNPDTRRSPSSSAGKR